jgi:hypothetical protein
METHVNSGKHYSKWKYLIRTLKTLQPWKLRGKEKMRTYCDVITARNERLDDLEKKEQ